MGYQIRMRDEELTDGAPTPAKSFEQAATQPVYQNPVTLSDRTPISAHFREGSIGTAPVGSVDYTTTAGERGRPAGTLEQELGASNAALQSQFARNPVVPNAPKVPRSGYEYATDPMMAQGFGVQLGDQLNREPFRGLTGMIEDRMKANLAARDGPSVTVTPDATTVRPPTPSSVTAPPGTTVRPFSDARNESQRGQSVPVPAPGQSVPVPSQSAAAPGQPAAPMTTEQANEYYGRQLAVMKAQENAALAHRDRESLRTTLSMQNAYEDRINRDNTARGMKAAQESILNRNKYGGYINDMTDKIAAVQGRPLAAQYGGDEQQGVVQNAIAAQDFSLRNKAAMLAGEKGKQDLRKGEQDLANNANTAAIEKMKLEQQTRMNDIHGKLMDPKLDPKEHDRLSRTLLSMLGKDKPEEYKVHPISLPDSVDPNTGAVLKGGQAAAIIDNRTGKYEIVRMQDGGESTAPPPNHVAALKKNPAMAAEFNKRYGAGAAEKILGVK